LASIVAAVVVASGACGPSPRESDDDDGPSSGAGAAGSGSNSASGSGGGQSDGGGGSGPADPGPPICLYACSTPADCDTGGGDPFTADNYECTGGGCIYTGCNSDSECQAIGDYVCRDFGAGVATCVLACAAPADCDIGGGEPFTAENYECSDGGCRYLGCTSDTECTGLGNYVCRDLGGGTPHCTYACSAPADCDLGSGAPYTAENYECDSGACRYIGCTSGECETLGPFVCVQP
jgi:hypothetical protein